MFTNASLTGCPFHIAKKLYRKITVFENKCLCKKNDAFNLRIKCFTALAFLPPADVVESFLKLTPNELIPIELVSYFDVVYIGAKRGPRNKRTRSTPLFPVELWNVHERTLENQFRTYNSIEAFHKALQSVTNTHPSL